jgi:two-component system cell cycle sensor histidine kinase/response regulator CckA
MMAKAQILIVEDDAVIAMELEERLRALGYAVCGVTAYGKEAVTEAARLQPDLVLMDIRLRGAMDGIEAAAQIGARFDIPILYLTAYADEQTLERAKLTEPFGYVLKPFEERRLHTAVEMALYKHTMERRLRESEQWLAATLRSIGDAVMATDPQGLISFLNPVAEALTGWQAEEALGQPVAAVLDLVQAETGLDVECPVGRVLEDGLVVDLANHLVRARDGTRTPIDGSAAVVRDDEGAVAGVVVVCRDVSGRLREQREREKLQDRLFEAQKMEAVGVLAGGIAHDLNNLMTTVIGYSSLMLSRPVDESLVQRGITSIKEAGERATSLLQQILDLDRSHAPEPKVLDLNAVVADMEELLPRLLGVGTEVIVSLEPGAGHVQADPAQLEQVIMNLVVNAHEAMPEGGALTVETGQERIRRAPSAQPGAFVSLSISDTGVGMDAETVEQIFEPFFSTKKSGTGLGLPIAATIVRHHDGWIEVDSQPGRGSTFRIYLPAVPAEPAREPGEMLPQPELQGRGERVLLVEDDEGVLAAVSEMLRLGGYTVTGVRSVEGALDAFEEGGQDFQLVFSDVVLPDKDGLELVDEVLSRKPDVAVLLTSGYTDERAQWTTISQRGYRFIQKPYSLSQLLAAVREALD